jgi:hypothetical protein
MLRWKMGLALGAVVMVFGSVGAAAQSSRFEEHVLKELNRLRIDPPAFSDEIADTRSRFDGRILRGRDGDEIDIMTNEGVAAVTEAVRVLRRSSAVAPTEPSDFLARVARTLVQEQSGAGAVGHISRGRGPGERSLALGGGRYLSEVITYGHSDPASVIEQFVVDDGVPDRGHRKKILAGEFRYAGAACGSHRVHRVMCVIILSPTRDGKAPPPPRREP